MMWKCRALAETGDRDDKPDLLVGECELLLEDWEEGGAHVSGGVDQHLGEHHEDEASAHDPPKG